MTAILMLSAIAMAVMLVLTLPLQAGHTTGSLVHVFHGTPADNAERLLAARYERGEISADDYQRVREVLYS